MPMFMLVLICVGTGALILVGTAYLVTRGEPHEREKAPMVLVPSAMKSSAAATATEATKAVGENATWYTTIEGLQKRRNFGEIAAINDRMVELETDDAEETAAATKKKLAKRVSSVPSMDPDLRGP